MYSGDSTSPDTAEMQHQVDVAKNALEIAKTATRRAMILACDKIASENQDQITVLTNQITSDNAYLPQAQIDVLVKTAVDKLVASALAAQSAGQIQILIDQAGITTPSAVITINVWTSQGA